MISHLWIIMSWTRYFTRDLGDIQIELEIVAEQTRKGWCRCVDLAAISKEVVSKATGLLEIVQ